MTTTTQPPVASYNHFVATGVFSYGPTSQATTPPQSSSSSQHQSPLQQDSSDCGSSSGVGGSGMTNKHESDASSLDSDSRDSGAGPPIAPQPLQNTVINQVYQHHLHQQRYPHPRHWAPTTLAYPPPPPLPGATTIQGNHSTPLRPLYTLTGATGYDTRSPQPPQPPSNIISAGPTMSQPPISTIPGVSSNSQTPPNGTPSNPVTSGIPNNAPPQSANGNHTVYVHVQPGETITINRDTDITKIPGPATIRMTGQNPVPPNALPLNVPPGHVVQQILNEEGRLQHVIISPVGSNVGVSGATTPLKGIPNAIPSTSNGNGASPKSISPPVPSQYSQGPILNPELIADPNYLAIRNLQQSNQWNGSKRSSQGYPVGIPPDSYMHPSAYVQMGPPSYMLPQGLPPNTAMHSYNGLGGSHAQVGDDTEYEFDDERERERLREALKSILPPQIQRILPKEVEVTWQEIDTSEAAASGGPFPQIDASEFVYEIFVYEGQFPTPVPACRHRCEPQPGGNVLKIEKLKPNTQYCVNIRASLPERDVLGEPSQPAYFKTLSILHETPPAPKIGNRGPTWMIVSWRNAVNTNMGMPMKSVLVQIAKDKGEFATVFESATAEYTRIMNLDPSTNYSVRIILRNETGDTKPSQPAYAQTMPSNHQSQASQQQQAPSHHHNGPSSSHEITVQSPKVVGVYNNGIKLVWNPIYGINNYTLEYCEARTNDFRPVDDACYTNEGGANISRLQSNREYLFRLNVVTDAGQTIRSEIVSAKTRKAQFDNSAYQGQGTSSGGPNTSYYDNNNRERLQIPTQLQKAFIDEKTLELTWRYSGREFDALIFILEGSITSGESNSQQETSWRICYKGPNTSAIVNDPALNLFRVQAVNSRRHATSGWSETLFVKRVVPRSKRSVPEATVSQPATPVVVTPTACTVPKFSEITWNSMQVQWKLAEELPEISSKISLIYELQRVDTEPIIIYSGDQTQFKLENLKPIEHVQVRARAVVVDYSGKRKEGDWSPIGSAATTCTAPSAPVNLRLNGEVLAWDPPTQLNGAEVRTYVLTGSKTSLNPESEEKAFTRKFGETSKTEFSLGKLEPATHYSIKVVAISKGGESEPSEVFEFDSPATEPESPQELHIEAVSSTELQLSWTPGADNGSPITGYRLFVHELASESRTASKHLVAQHQIPDDVTSFVTSKLKPETLYELQIEAQNSVGASESVSMRCETFASPPDPPELSLVQAQSSVLKLKWQPAVASSSTVEPCYFYLEKENDFGTFSPVFEGESKMAKIKGLREQTIHRFRIRSAHAKGILSLMGPWSPTYEFATTRPPPQAVRGSLMVSEVSQSVFQIEWTPVKMVTTVPGVDDEADQYVYRLQVTPKMERRNVVEPWKTVYEGTCNSYTLALSPSSTSTRMARVFVVQKMGNEELVSAPSAVAQFSSCRTPTESPRKRVNKPTSGTSTPSQASEDDTPTRSPSSVHQAKRMNWYRRTKKWINWIRKSLAERNNAAFVLLLFFILAMFIALFLNNYYQL